MSKILPGHYNNYLESLSKTIETTLQRYKYELNSDTYLPVGQLVITNLGLKQMRIDRDLANFLGIGRELKNLLTFVKRLRSPTAYFIHCDLIYKTNNLFNGKKSDLLAKFDVKGKPYEKVSYYTSPQQPFRDCSTDSHVNSITLSVRGQDGELFDFNDMPIEFELEIN